MVRKRILQYIYSKGISKYKFYKQTGLSNGFLDKDGSMNSDNCELIILRYTDINPEWLLIGVGPMLREDLVLADAPEIIPLVTLETAANIVKSHFEISAEDILDHYVVPDFNDIDFMIRLKGSSMNPKYNSGDIVACRIIKDSKFFQWNKTYIIATKEQGILCKRLKQSANENFYLAVSDNPDYEPFELPKDEITGIALVVGVIRQE